MSLDHQSLAPATGWLRLPGMGRVARFMAADADRAGTWFRAGTAFAIRVASAGLLFVSQVLLARWMGTHDFGVYIYAWTLVLIVGDLVPLGFMFSAQRYIPEYRQTGEAALLRGFLRTSRNFVWAMGCLGAVLSIAAVWLASPWLDRETAVVVAIAATALPAYAYANLLDGVARSFDRVNLALVPPFIVRPILLIAAVAGAHAAGIVCDAPTAMTVAVAATWAPTIVQGVLVERHLAQAVPPGPPETRFREWLGVSLQIFGAWSFVVLFNYADVIVLYALSTPGQVGIYYAAVKTLALTSFIAYAVASVYAHKFVERKVAGDQEGLARLVAASVALTFWPSLALTAGLLLVGRQVLALFGPDFAIGYDLLFILSIGLLARAAVGPAERILNMLGEQARSAGIYAAALAVTILLALALVPASGLHGAAVAITGGTVTEAVLLAVTVRRRLGLHAFVFRRRTAG